MTRSTTGSHQTQSPTGGLHHGRRLRLHRQRLPSYAAGVRDLDSDELVLAVAFLAKALHLPDLDPQVRPTSKYLGQQPEVLRAA